MSGPRPGGVATARASTVAAHVAPSALTPSEQVRFLESARVTRVRAASKGVTGTQRATLSTGATTHDASIQTIDVSKASFQTARRVELGFRDYWGFNIAAYRLAVMVGLDMVPPSVARRYRTRDAAFTWWVDDVILDEEERVKQKREPPSPARWTAQMHVLRVFDELIANVDRNQGNMLIDTRWKIWLIDHTRAFRTTATLREPATIVRCERSLLDGMRALSLRDAARAARRVPVPAADRGDAEAARPAGEPHRVTRPWRGLRTRHALTTVSGGRPRRRLARTQPTRRTIEGTS